MTVKVNCVKCDHENIVEFERLRNLHFVKCEKCSEEFNLFGVYDSLYHTIPLCQRMVDVTVDHTYSNYHIEATKPEEQKEIERTFEKNSFPDLYRQMLRDMILYGNSFVQIISKHPILGLNRLKPTELEFRIDWAAHPPFRSLQQKIVEIRSFDGSKEYDVKNCLHFKGGLASHEPIGDSILGMWFTTWYFLRDVPEMVPLLDLGGERLRGLKWFRDFEESGVLGASGIPHNLIFPWMRLKSRFNQIEHQRFRHDIERRRSTVSRLLERKLFPTILGRDYEYENFPRLTFRD